MNLKYDEIRSSRNAARRSPSRKPRSRFYEDLDNEGTFMSIDPYFDEKDIEIEDIEETRTTIDILLSIENLLKEIKEKLAGKKDSELEGINALPPLSNSFLQTFTPEDIKESVENKTTSSVEKTSTSSTARSSMLEEIQSVLAQTATQSDDVASDSNVVSSACSLSSNIYDDNV